MSSHQVVSFAFLNLPLTGSDGMPCIYPLLWLMYCSRRVLWPKVKSQSNISDRLVEREVDYKSVVVVVALFHKEVVGEDNAQFCQCV